MSTFISLDHTELQKVGQLLESRGLFFLIPERVFSYSKIVSDRNEFYNMLSASTSSSLSFELAESAEICQIERGANDDFTIEKTGLTHVQIQRSNVVIGHVNVASSSKTKTPNLSSLNRHSILSKKFDTGISFIDQHTIQGFNVRLLKIPFVYEDYFWLHSNGKHDLFLQLGEEVSNCVLYGSQAFWRTLRSTQNYGISNS